MLTRVQTATLCCVVDTGYIKHEIAPRGSNKKSGVSYLAVACGTVTLSLVMVPQATKETNVAHALYGSKCTGIQCPVFERRENERRRL